MSDLFIYQCTSHPILQLELKSPSSLQGKLRTRSELDQYKEVWHSRIFTPHWNSLKETVSYRDWCNSIDTWGSGVTFCDDMHEMHENR